MLDGACDILAGLKPLSSEPFTPSPSNIIIHVP